MQLSLSAEDEESPEKKAAALEASLAKLNEIFDEHPSTELAVKLISGQSVGKITLEGVRSAAKRARKEAKRAAEQARKEAEESAKFEKWLKLAEQGDVYAQTSLGVMYRNGEGVPKNDAEAVKWFRKAVEQGYAGAQFNLGLMLDNGRGVPKNYDEAFKWYRKAAERGHADAQYNLGNMYHNGSGVPVNKAKAIKWWLKAAEQGHEDSKREFEILEAK